MDPKDKMFIKRDKMLIECQTITITDNAFTTILILRGKKGDHLCQYRTDHYLTVQNALRSHKISGLYPMNNQTNFKSTNNVN